MSDNTLQGYVWPESIVVMVSGHDAERYLHNRLTQDIRSLQINEAKFFAATNAQSKIQAIGSILKLENNTYLLFSTLGNRDSFIKAISEFKVADRVIFEPILEARITSIVASDNLSTSMPEGMALQRITEKNSSFREVAISENRRCFCLSTAFGFDLIELAPPFRQIQQICWKRFNYIRVNERLPLFTIDFDDNTLVMDTGLKDHIGFGAGCYVGQEVIEKIDARGKAPHRFNFFKCEDTDNSLTASALVESLKDGVWKISGKITSCAPSPDNSRYKCLIAFVRNEDSSEYRSNGIPLTPNEP
jgi:folate-binding protein YgfZ